VVEMKSIDMLVKKALEYKEKGLSEKEIGDELHLSPRTITWLLTRGMRDKKPPIDVKIGWRSIGVYGSRIGYIASILSDIIVEELDKRGEEADSILGVSINGVPFATLVSEEMDMELMIYRPSPKRKGIGAFSSNYAGVEGKKVVIIDDVLDSGETAKGAIAALQDNGGTAVLVAVVVNKTENDDIVGVPLRALIRARSIV
jgi:orotate phosphoribosyltransferase